MIEVTKMNGQIFFLNCSQIYRVDSTPDTVITTLDGKTILVKETPETIAKFFLDYQKNIYRNHLWEI